MLPEVTYADFQAYGGTLSEDDFNVSLNNVLPYVDNVIGFNVPQDENDEAAYKRAVFAGMTVDYTYGASGGIGEGMVSMSVGSFSATFGSVSMQSSSQPTPYERDMLKAIRRALHGSSLLYQGLQ